MIVHKNKFCRTKSCDKIPLEKDLLDTLHETAVSYDVVKRRSREFKSTSQSCKNEHASATPTSAATQENGKKFHDLVLQNLCVTIR